MNRILFLVFTLYMSVELRAQTWHSYHYTEFTSNQLVYTDVVSGARHFKINPHNNSMWFSRVNRVQTIGGNGQVSSYHHLNVPAFIPQGEFGGFAFQGDTVYLVDQNYGICKFDGTDWNFLYSGNECIGVFTDEDTLWVTQSGGNNIMKFYSVGIQESIVVPFQRIVVRDGIPYGSNDLIGGIGFKRIENGVSISYNTSNSMIMDIRNYDFKFSPHTDTMYVAGQKGLSLLHDLVFFDSIAPDNTTNMPTGVILDFEFDANDNIWALFGTDGTSPYAVAHYDQGTENWDAYYDESNSPIDFSYYASIELDTAGNLWLANQYYLYLLELEEAPFWLSTPEVAGLEAVSLYPNPSSDKVHILADATKVRRMVLRDVAGRIVYDAVFSEEFSVSGFSPGTYVVELKDDNGQLLESRRLVVQ